MIVSTHFSMEMAEHTGAGGDHIHALLDREAVAGVYQSTCNAHIKRAGLGMSMDLRKFGDVEHECSGGLFPMDVAPSTDLISI